MNLNECNFKHARMYCYSCKTQSHTLYDEFHGEIYCSKCGIVLHRMARTPVSRKKLEY